MEKLGFTSLKLQKKNGSTWTNVVEITNVFYFSANTFSYSDSFVNQISGAQYRVQVTLRARRTQGEVQDLTITSNSIICH